MKLCKNCNNAPIGRPRYLCWSCFYTPGVREQFPSTSKFARRGVRNFNGRAAPCEPTDALPGTDDKLAVLEQRAEAGQELWHPLDAKGIATKPEPAELKPERNAAMIRRRREGAAVRELMKEFCISENAVRRVLEREVA